MPRFFGGPLDGLDVPMDVINRVGQHTPSGTPKGSGTIMPGRPELDRIVSGELPSSRSRGYTVGARYFYRMDRVDGGVEFHFTASDPATTAVTPWTTFRIGYGSREQMPPTVRKVYELLEDGEKQCVIDSYSDSEIGGSRGFGSRVFWGRESRDTDILADVYDGMAHFLAGLADPGTDVLSLVFVNFKPSTHPFSEPARPNTIVTVADLAAGLRSFCGWVVGSLRDLNSPCEWVMLSCYRRPADGGDQDA
jgi:hypothetical protein